MKNLALLLCLFVLVGCGQSLKNTELPVAQKVFTWETIETNTDDYKLSYPRFTSGSEAIITSLNTDLPSGITSFVDQATQAAPEIPWQLSMTPQYQYADDLFQSLVLAGYDYSGGERGNHYYGVVNYDVVTEKFIALPDLFADDSYLKTLAEFVRSELVLLKGESTEVLEAGTAPDIKNFKIFTFEDGPEGRGLKFYFAPYQFGPTEPASFEILVPVGILSEFVNEAYSPWFGDLPLDSASYTGMKASEAQALAASRNVPFRVVMEDGVTLIVTEDYIVGRINAVVEEGVVVSYKVEGS